MKFDFGACVRDRRSARVTNADSCVPGEGCHKCSGEPDTELEWGIQFCELRCLRRNYYSAAMGNRNLYAVLAELTNAGNHVLLDGDCKESFRLRVFSNLVIYDWRANGVPIDADRWDRPTGILGRRRACAQCAIFRSLGCGSRFDG